MTDIPVVDSPLAEVAEVAKYARLEDEVISHPATLARDDIYLACAPREHRQWNWNGDIDTDLSDFNIMFEFPSGRSGLREDSSPITIAIGVNQSNGIIESVSLKHNQNRSKYLLSYKYK